jgi:squalene/oxidosqualene cyclase-like protein
MADEFADGVVWKLEVERGRQRWFPMKKGEYEQTFVEQHLLTKISNNPNPKYDPNDKPKFSSPEEATKEAVNFYSKLQTEDGHWAGDYGGPMFLLPGLIIVCYITGVLSTLKKPYIDQMIRYILAHQNSDGGYGLHIESGTSLFGSVLNYVALRLLGVSADHESCVKTRSYFKKQGGILGTAQWGKLYLCTLNLMDWRCVDPIPPELWLLPKWFPYVQPGKWWCHCRVVYLPMGYIYGVRGTAKLNPLLLSLRDELYGPGQYEVQPWVEYQSYVHPSDNYYPATIIYKILAYILAKYEKYMGLLGLRWLRKKATDCAIDHIIHEDKTTNHIDIGPVNKVLNMLSVYYAEGPESENFKAHIPRLLDYLWLSDDGMKMQGYNGSQLWDTAFAVQAIYTTGMTDMAKNVLSNAYKFIDVTQVRENVDNLEKYHRHISKGAWPFSTYDHGWPISDCTAEGLKATLCLQELDYIDRSVIDADRLYEAVDVILSLHNKDSGGWATYELSRTSPIIEYINPAALFGEIMIDYPHTECTSACVTALLAFQKRYPTHRKKEVDFAINSGIKFLKKKQLSDGGWYGGWAVCFCYGTWFALTAFSAFGMKYEKETCIQRGCEFLLSKQLPDGGWGESYLSSVTHKYVQPEHGQAQVVNTAWALLALMQANYPDRKPIDRGIALLMKRQLPNGDFPQENISGVFNHNCMISYSNYRNIFPIWALGMYLKKYKQ